jgi:succinate dehydrogenase / fumarate reductase cytochrome b subunit
VISKPRPKHLDLIRIKLPLPGFVSILHRASGALLFLALPLLLAAFDQSLRSIETYTSLTEYLAHPLAKIFVLGMTWALLHHFCAGLRYLALDLHLLHGLAGARTSSKWVLAVSLLLTVVVGVKLW